MAKLRDAAFDKLAKAVQVPLVARPTKFIDLGKGPKDTDYDDVFSDSPVLDEWADDPLEELGYVQEGDFYVRIKDLRSDDLIYFRGYVTGITENLNPSWTSTNYIGRSEPVYLYERAERDLSFNLRVYPANKIQLVTMYEKLNKLTSLSYPDYLSESSLGDAATSLGLDIPGVLEDKKLVRMQAPFTELYMGHIGSRGKGQFGFIKSLTYTVNETGDWDSHDALPRLFDIAISYQILSKKPPSMGDTFYPVKISSGLDPRL